MQIVKNFLNQWNFDKVNQLHFPSVHTEGVIQVALGYN